MAMKDDDRVSGGTVDGKAGSGKTDGLTTSDSKPKYGMYGSKDFNGLKKTPSAEPKPDARGQNVSRK